VLHIHDVNDVFKLTPRVVLRLGAPALLLNEESGMQQYKFFIAYMINQEHEGDFTLHSRHIILPSLDSKRLQFAFFYQVPPIAISS
jgi:hypothetical protein